MNDAMRSVLDNLRDGPKTTLHLQRFCGTTHAAKPIFDLRQLGYVISRKSLPNRVALYSLISEPGSPVGVASRTAAASSRGPVPEFGDVSLIRAMRR